MKQFYVIFAFMLCAGLAQAQFTLRGNIKDDQGEDVVGATVQIRSLNRGTTSDASGNYSIGSLGNGTYTVRFSYTGSATLEKPVTISGADAVLDAVMVPDASTLGEVVISVGSRASQRTLTSTPLPVDILGAKDIASTGQVSFDKALQYRVPSFNTVNTPVNDATTLLDPYEIRNMGPSRTLILIDGKRKNLSSLLYVQFSPGRGETGVDLAAIPTDAIKRVEILRDGASAQYGSDAIAGVMNVILKDKYEYTTLNINAGTTTKKDDRAFGQPAGNGRGDNYSVALNSGANFADRGYVNYTLEFSQQESAIRSGIVDIPTEIATFGGSPAADASIRNYLADHPTGNNINGTGKTTAGKFLINAGLPIGENGKVYANAAMVTKKVFSFANFRTPYWRVDRGLLHSVTDNGGKNYLTESPFAGEDVNIYRGYVGYVPTFEGDLKDYNATLGVKDEHYGWTHDLSLTVGGNQQLYTVNNTVNRTLGTASPTSFKPGGYNFSHIVGNLDISKALTDNFSIGLGSEARTETYRIIAGDTASYSGEGSNSFPGLNAVNATTNSRYNLGFYVDANWDITEDFLLNGTVRTENYSDFGKANVFKASSRYKFAQDKVTLRASVSTGFRAPTLHQIYAQSVQAAFVGGFIQLSGLFNNRSVQARLLGIPNLKPEKSTNFTLGVGLNPLKNLNITLDYYTINVQDRIVYSSSISSSDPNSVLGKILAQGGVKTIQFFINGIETNTGGLDYVVNYRNLALGNGTLGVNLAGNFTLVNEIVGTPNDPAPIKADGATILNSQIKSLLTESRPNYKTILGFDYKVGKFGTSLNNTLFGKTAFQDLDNGGGAMNYIKQEFKPAVVTDLMLSYDLSKKVTLSIFANNLLNILPKWDLRLLDEQEVRDLGLDPTKQAYRDAKATLADAGSKSLLRGFLGFSGRYDILGYNGSQFSQLGTMLNANLRIQF
jgi:iron complex outermembrane recepter protein